MDESVRKTIALYNADDCLSTRSLRNWLQQERLRLEKSGTPLARRQTSDGAPSEVIGERQRRTAELAEKLLSGIAVDPELRTEEEAARWPLANLLDWHRRESKAERWEYFRLSDLTDEDLIDERSALSGLQFLERVWIRRNIPVDRYSFPNQETDIRAEDKLCEKGEKIGEMVAIDIAARTIDIRKTKRTAEIHPTSVFKDETGPSHEKLADALFRLGSWVASHVIDAHGSYRAARDLLLRRSPRVAGGSSIVVQANESDLEAAKRLGVLLDHSVLPIQGPPGAGKTFTAARMICELVRQGKRVGITANSHKVIRNLLDEVIIAAKESGLDGLTCVQKVNDKPDAELPGIRVTTDNAEPISALRQGVSVVAGTIWLWAREEYFESVDVLFVDEAGQMSLANVLAATQAAKSLVLLGDPQQLEQPLKGSHPEGAEISALEHLLAGANNPRR